jgi:CBS domain containing-hemolysin-like protein
MHFLIAGNAAWIVFTLWGQGLTLVGTLGIFLGLLLVIYALEFLTDREPLKEPERWALRLSGTALVLDVVLTPLSLLMAVLQGSNGIHAPASHTVTEDELKTWVESEQPEGGLEEDERRMIYSIFQFGDTLCREIMVPRIDVHALEVTTPLDQAIDEMIRSGHSRVPVFENSIDNVLGLLYQRPAQDTLQRRHSRSA